MEGFDFVVVVPFLGGIELEMILLFGLISALVCRFALYLERRLLALRFILLSFSDHLREDFLCSIELVK